MPGVGMNQRMHGTHICQGYEIINECIRHIYARGVNESTNA